MTPQEALNIMDKEAMRDYPIWSEDEKALYLKALDTLQDLVTQKQRLGRRVK